MRFQHAGAAALALSAGAVLVAVPLARASASPARPSAPAAEVAHPPVVLSPPQVAEQFHEFFFTRGIYADGRGGFGRGGFRRGSWATDYPKADQQFMVVLKRLIDIDNNPMDHAVDLGDPEIRRFPFV